MAEFPTRMFERLIRNWVYGGACSALLLLLLAPLLVGDWTAPWVATFLLLPAYMIHQYEEHDGDRFRIFFNQTLGKGHEVLSPRAVFVANVPGVWGVIAVSLYGALVQQLGLALIAVYLVVINAFVHLAHAAAFRRYNPGLATALVVFFPLGGYTMWLIQRAGAGSVGYHGLGVLTAVAIHAGIMVHVRRQLGRLQGN